MIPDSDLLEIKQHEGRDYKPLVDFEAWRVALMNFDKKMSFSGLKPLERHNATDEVFVLLEGTAVLLLAGRDEKPAPQLHSVRMQPNTLYNVRKAVWHGLLMSRDCKTLIVENVNTNDSNSETSPISTEQRQSIAAFHNEF